METDILLMRMTILSSMSHEDGDDDKSTTIQAAQ